MFYSRIQEEKKKKTKIFNNPVILENEYDQLIAKSLPSPKTKRRRRNNDDGPHKYRGYQAVTAEDYYGLGLFSANGTPRD